MKEGKGLRYTVIGARIVLGLIFTVFGAMYFFWDKSGVDATTPSGQFFSALLATGYFLPFLKVTEVLSGLMLFFKRTTPLALLVLAPIILHILLYHVFMEPKGLAMAGAIFLLALFLAWAHWDNYKGLFKA